MTTSGEEDRRRQGPFEAVDDFVRRVPYLDDEGRRCVFYVCQAGDPYLAQMIADALNSTYGSGGLA